MSNYTIYTLSLDGENHRYVGLTTISPEKRLRQHKQVSSRGKAMFPLYKWMRALDDPDDVIMTVIETTDDKKLLSDLEIYWIARLREEGHRLLNCTPGGYGVPYTPEIGAKISESLRGRKFSPERCLQMSERMTGRVFSEEHKENLSKALKGRKQSPELIAKLSAIRKGKTPWNVGIPQTKEQRAKITATKRERGNLVDPNTLDKLIDSGDRGRHTRWHANRNIIKEGCGFCEQASS